MIARYSFAKFPKLEDLGADHQTFGVGKFKDFQIEELRIYNDGIIVGSRSNSAFIDEFIDDLFSWAEKELGMVPMITSKPEKYYESSIVVKSRNDLTKVMGLNAEICSGLNKKLASKYIATSRAASSLIANPLNREAASVSRFDFLSKEGSDSRLVKMSSFLKRR